MDERLRFVARLLDGESMTEVCREFGISRKTGYKIFTRYKDQGLEALTRPVAAAGALRQPAAAPDRKPDRHPQAGEAALGCAQDSRAPGAAPGRRRPHPGQEHHPRGACTATGWSKASAGRDHAPHGTPLSPGIAPNDLWCADFKGEFKLGNGEYCYPLTVTDHASRYLLLCEALDSVREDTAITAFQQLFLERGLPGGHSLRQRRALRQPQRAVQPLQAIRLVAAPGHRHRAHQARPPAAERPPRAHAPDA